MAYGDILSGILDVQLVDATGAWSIHSEKVADGIVAIIWSDGSNHGWCRTYPIAADGTVGLLIEELEFDPTFYFARQHNIVEVAERIWLVMYRGPLTKLKAVTISIGADGTGIAVKDSLTTALACPTACEYAAKKGTTNTCYVAVWYDGDQDGQMATFTCDSDGDNITLADNWEFEPVKAYLPQVEYISGDIFAISYNDSLGVGQISTVAVADDGTITELLINTQEVDAVNNSLNINMAKIGNGDLVFLAYSSTPGGAGLMATLTIDNLGVISAPIDTGTYDVFDGSGDKAIKLGTSSDVSYVMIYYFNTDDGADVIRTFSVAADGTISAEIDSLVIQDVTADAASWAAEVRVNLWVFPYSANSDTYFNTAKVDTVQEVAGGQGASMADTLVKAALI